MKSSTVASSTLASATAVSSVRETGNVRDRLAKDKPMSNGNSRDITGELVFCVLCQLHYDMFLTIMYCFSF